MPTVHDGFERPSWADPRKPLEEAEQFEHNHDNDNYSDYIEDASVDAVLISEWICGGLAFIRLAADRRRRYQPGNCLFEDLRQDRFAAICASQPPSRESATTISSFVLLLVAFVFAGSAEVLFFCAFRCSQFAARNGQN